MIAAYPWSELHAVSRDDGRFAEAAHWLLSRFDLERLRESMQRLLAIECESYGVTGEACVVEESLATHTVALEWPEASLLITAEPELVAFAVSRLLDRPLRVAEPAAALGPALNGAWHALVFEFTRRLIRGSLPAFSPRPPPSLRALRHETWLRLEGRSFRVILHSEPKALPARSLDRDVPLWLPLVLEQATISRAELGSLRIGDALMLGSSGARDASAARRVMAIGAQQEHGFELQLSEASVQYLGSATLPLEPPQEEGEDVEPKQKEEPTRESVIMNAPVIVRVEVGGITLSAREWLALKPGDILSCGQPPGGPVTLRAAGTAVARGELITVDGELGVRITQFPSVEPESAGVEPNATSRESG